jgi:hypothetical protein
MGFLGEMKNEREYTMERFNPMDELGNVTWRDTGKPLTEAEYHNEIISKLCPDQLHVNLEESPKQDR